MNAWPRWNDLRTQWITGAGVIAILVRVYWP